MGGGNLDGVYGHYHIPVVDICIGCGRACIVLSHLNNTVNRDGLCGSGRHSSVLLEMICRINRLAESVRKRQKQFDELTNKQRERLREDETILDYLILERDNETLGHNLSPDLHDSIRLDGVLPLQ